MATTELFAELLVIGIGAAIWLALLLGAVFGYRVDGGLPTIDTSALVALAGVAYVFGIVVDRLAYDVFRGVERRLSKTILGTRDLPAPAILEREILTGSKILGSQIQYNRSRLRICRAWTLNGAFITLAYMAWNFTVGAAGWWQSATLAGMGSLLCVSSAWAARRLTRDHYNNLKESYEFLRNRKSRYTEPRARR
jgi:hypothetical protein